MGFASTSQTFAAAAKPPPDVVSFISVDSAFRP